MPDGLDPQPSKFGQSETRIFLDLALERGYATREQVDEIIEIRGKLREMGLEEEVQALMVKKGFITERDAQRIGKVLSGYRRLGNYEIVARIGQGSMGSVFKARQISMDRNVALKILPPKLAADEAYVQRFFREARAVAKLNHVNIVQGIDVGEEKGYYYFAMEYVEGITCREMLKSKGPYREKEALEIVVQVARALDHASKAGLVHRDVKPDNVIVTPQGVAKLLDLGIAKTTDAAGEEGVRLGTPYYISPEQARGDADVDTRSDIYSLGATFYHMVVGSPPFSGSSADEVIRAHLTATVPNPREVRPGLSRNVSRVIEMMMARDPNDRYQSASDVLFDLDKVSRGLPPSKAKSFRGSSSVAVGPETAPTGTTRPVTGVAARPAVPLAAIVGGAVTLIVLVVIVVVIILSQEPGPGPLPRPQPHPQPQPQPQPRPQPRPDDSREKAAQNMYDYALEEIKKDPDDLEGAIRLIGTVVADTKGTATNLRAQKKLRDLRASLDAVIKKQMDDLWAKAEAAGREHRYAEAIKTLDGFKASYRSYPRWKTTFSRNRGEMQKRAEAWLKAQEKSAADLTAAKKFADAREVLKAMAVSGMPGVEERIATGTAAIAKAEKDYAKFLEQEKVRLAAERARIRKIQHQKFLRELYSRHRTTFETAEAFCETAKGEKAYDLIKDLIEAEVDDLARMQAAEKQTAALLAAVSGNVTISYGGQQFTGKIEKEGAGLRFNIKGGFASFPLDPAKMVPAEVISLTGYDSGGAARALDAGLFLTWRGDYPAARIRLKRAEGDAAKRGLLRLDMLEKGLTELAADEVIARARKAFAAKDHAAFAAALEELRTKYAKTKAYAAARAELERMALGAAIAGMSLEGLCAATKVSAEGDMLAFEYDFNPDTSQVVDWESAINMWPWNQTIFDRKGIDTWLTDGGKLMIQAPGKRLLQVRWAVPIAALRRVEFEVTPRKGTQSIGLGLGRPDIYKSEDRLRTWFSSQGKPYLLQGKDRRKEFQRELRLKEGKTYRVSLEVAGGDAVLKLDGREVLRDKLTFDVSRGCRLVLGSWRAEAEFDSMKIVCRPTASWLKERAETQAHFRREKVKPGVLAEYFADRDLRRSVLKRVESGMHFWWNRRAPAPKMPKDNFSVRFTGKIYVEKAGRYRLHQRADDHGRLWINGQKVIDDRFNKGADVDLKAGFNDFRMEVVEGGGFAGQELSWEGKDLPRQVIPPYLLGH